MLKINDMLLKQYGFQYALSLDLSMQYNHIQLSKNESNLCTISLPLGKYCYTRLPMIVANYSEILQLKINDLFHGYKLICA